MDKYIVVLYYSFECWTLTQSGLNLGKNSVFFVHMEKVIKITYTWTSLVVNAWALKIQLRF